MAVSLSLSVSIRLEGGRRGRWGRIYIGRESGRDQPSDRLVEREEILYLAEGANQAFDIMYISDTSSGRTEMVGDHPNHEVQ